MSAISLSLSTGARRAPSFISRIIAARAVAKQRTALSRLSDAQLKDIGLTREQAEAESTRPVWDAPQNWRA